MLYQILKASKLGAAAAPDMFTGLLAAQMPFAKGSGEIAELSGVPPLSFKANGQPLLDWRIEGNAVQSGTPTSQNPVSVQGVGELDCGQYKIPISSGGVTTNIYLGSTQTTRQIKKLELTGNENWETQTGQYCNNTALFTLWQRIIGIGKMQNRPSVNTHFISAASGVNPQTQNYVCSGYHPIKDYSEYYYIRPSFSTIGITSETTGANAIAAFKAWLAAQYANGTPVTLYYVLATPQTATINEPLMKIGDYVDSIDMAQAGIQIPTVRGNNILTIDTAVKPSEVYIKYKK